MDTSPRYVIDDNTERTPLHLLPSLEEVEEVVAKYPSIEISFYNPGADPREPWLWLDTPKGVVRITEGYEPAVFESIVKRAHESGIRIECPRCGYETMQGRKPYGKQHCVGCYRNRREMVEMRVRGETVRKPVDIARAPTLRAV